MEPKTHLVWHVVDDNGDSIFIDMREVVAMEYRGRTEATIFYFSSGLEIAVPDTNDNALGLCQEWRELIEEGEL